MRFASWFRNTRRVGKRSAAHHRQRSFAKLFLERLEHRVVPVTNMWTTPAGGDWSNPANWNQGHVPLSSEDVVIPSLNTGAVVTHSTGTDTINNLTVGGSLTLTGGSLTVNIGIFI